MSITNDVEIKVRNGKNIRITARPVGPDYNTRKVLFEISTDTEKYQDFYIYIEDSERTKVMRIAIGLRTPVWNPKTMQFEIDGVKAEYHEHTK